MNILKTAAKSVGVFLHKQFGPRECCFGGGWLLLVAGIEITHGIGWAMLLGGGCLLFVSLLHGSGKQ